MTAPRLCRWRASSVPTRSCSTSACPRWTATRSAARSDGSPGGACQTLFSRIAESADVLALCGDLTDRGLADEARILARELQAVKIPKVAVLGNHDYESDAAGEVISILAEAHVTVLDGTA